MSALVARMNCSAPSQAPTRSTGIAERWIGVNNWLWDRFTRTRLDLRVDGELRTDGHYLVLANHQSWVDILVLQKVFNRRIPFLRFFLKRQLFWVPVLGLAWWALDFPFMKRHSKEYLKKHPEMKGKDAETTRRACEKFRHIPISVMNFVEGTRFTPEKHDKQNSPFKHLLKPKAGGTGLVLSAMGDQLHRLLDVTIVYPKGAGSFWDFLCGKVQDIRVHVRSLPITPELVGDYENDNEYRARFQQWLNALWHEKDARIEAMLKTPG